MSTYRLKYPKGSIGKARSFRRTMTDAGRRLWSRLRNNQLGVHFRREVPHGPYYCDFLCLSAKLVIEVDGSQHYTHEGHAHDEKRDAYLRDQGYTVFRFSDRDVLLNTEGVLQTIYEHICRNSKTHLTCYAKTASAFGGNPFLIGEDVSKAGISRSQASIPSPGRRG
ncbi:MAG: endonuclease domain-containing protein [Ignavibacteria bacterium]|nr:endonuclease domain-containing protein [Ignavibacteria bacterium]MBI3765653.1 endonuclease domain-containing protein [Ignavibacteriales bacterium]